MSDPEWLKVGAEVCILNRHTVVDAHVMRITKRDVVLTTHAGREERWRRQGLRRPNDSTWTPSSLHAPDDPQVVAAKRAARRSLDSHHAIEAIQEWKRTDSPDDLARAVELLKRWL